MPEIPISNILSEANPNSLQDLFSRNPEIITDSDLDFIILRIREQRDRIESSPTRVRATRIKAPPTPVNPEDFGL